MSETRGATIDYQSDEEPILRRLGGALIVHWDQLTTEMQDLLIQQAADMGYGDDPVHAFEIKTFIIAHKGGD